MADRGWLSVPSTDYVTCFNSTRPHAVLPGERSAIHSRRISLCFHYPFEPFRTLNGDRFRRFAGRGGDFATAVLSLPFATFSALPFSAFRCVTTLKAALILCRSFDLMSTVAIADRSGDGKGSYAGPAPAVFQLCVLGGCALHSRLGHSSDQLHG